MNFKITEMKNLEETKSIRDLISRIAITRAMHNFTIEENKSIGKCIEVLRSKVEVLSK